MVDGGAINQLDSGQIFISGIATGINTGALIEAAYQQKVRAAVLIDQRISENSAKIEGFKSLQSLAGAVESSLSNLKSNTSVLDNNAFDSRAGFLSATSVDPTSVIGVSIDDDAAIGNYSIEVISAAQEQRVTSDSSFSPSAALGYTGSFTIGLFGGATSTINVSATDSLNDISAAIAAETATTNVTANVIETGPGEYRLVLAGNENAQPIQAIFTGGDDVLQNIGITSDGAGTLKNIAQNEQAAQILFDGILITRDTNDFQDIVPGVDITVLNESPGTVINLEVGNDVQTIKEDITAFVDAYNEYRAFAITQQELSEGGEVSEESVLFANNTLRQLNSEINTLINTIFNPAGDIQSMRDLGITFTPNNTLSIDNSTLDDALLNNFDNVRAYFEAGITSDDPNNLRLITNNSLGGDLAFTLDITTDGSGAVTSAGVGGDTSLFTVSGTSIVGAAGTIYEGLTLAYVGGVNTSINVNFSQGFADAFSNKISEFSDSVSGVLQDEILALGQTNSELGEDSQRIIERAEVYRQREIEKYAELERAVSQAKFIQNFIKALVNSGNDD